MKNDIPGDNKLTVIILIEPGCLGPNGAQLVNAFCGCAQTFFTTLSSSYIEWKIAAQIDKTQPEISYIVNDKKLTQLQAKKYLQILTLQIDKFEDQLNDRIAFMIEQYQIKHKSLKAA